MSRILIPRSDSISAKIIEPSDFEKMFSSDILRDYRKSGFAITAGSGLAVNIAVVVARVKGLYIESDSSESVASLTANSPNYIYITLARDSNSEAESRSFTKNTTGTTPADSFPLGTVKTKARLLFFIYLSCIDINSANHVASVLAPPLEEETSPL